MYKNKKHGFTLIEVMMYLCLIVVISVVTISSVSFINKIKLSVGIKNDIGKIHDVLVMGKAISNGNRIAGKVVYDKENNYIEYYNKEYGFRMDLNYVIIKDINSSTGFIEISDNGMITTACTITISGDDGENYKITINVGSFTIDVKT